MRLIDANKLVVDARLGEDEIPYVSKAQIDEAEEAEAIPIEWIKVWLNDENNKATIEFFQPTFEDVMEWLIEDWEAENETN